MARFRKVDPRIWNDAKFASLSGEAKLMFLYLLTSPSMTVLGALPMRASAVAEELGLDSERYGKRYQELYQRGMVEYDSRGLFWVRNYMKYNGPDNPKVVISWSSALDLLPECPLLYKVLESARNHCVSRGKGFPKAFTDTLGNCLKYGMSYGMPNKEKEKEKEKEYLDVSDETSSSANANVRESVEEAKPELFLNSGTGDRTAEEGQTTNEEPKPAKRNPPLPFQRVIDLYNAHCTPSLPSARLTDKRKDEIRLRWKDLQQFYGLKTEEETLAAFEKFFERVSESDFLNGRTDAAFRADLPWLLQREKFDATLNGRYDKRERTAIDRNGHKGTSPLPDHLNPHLRFDEAYYTKENPFKPDGSLNWKD